VVSACALKCCRLFLWAKSIYVEPVDIMGSEVDEVFLTSVSINKQNGRKTLCHLPNRPAVDIEFTDVSYTVPQGRKGKSQTFN